MHIAALSLLVTAFVPLSLGHAWRRGNNSSTFSSGTLYNTTYYNGTTYNGTYYNGTSLNGTSYNSSSSLNANGETYSARMHNLIPLRFSRSALTFFQHSQMAVPPGKTHIRVHRPLSRR